MFGFPASFRAYGAANPTQRNRITAAMISHILLAAIVFWLVAIFYTLRKGFDQIIRGLNSIDERLAKISSELHKGG